MVWLCSLFVWLWLVVNDRKFPAGIVFFSHTNQPAVLLYEPATIRTSQQAVLHPNLLLLKSLWFSIQSRYLLHAVGLMGSFSFLLFDFVFNGSLINISWVLETDECNSHIFKTVRAMFKSKNYLKLHLVSRCVN